MRIVRHSGGDGPEFSKRTQLPFDVTADCPQCGVESTTDLMEYSLSYPTLGVVSISMLCVACSHDWSENAEFGVTLTPVSPQ